MPVNRHFYCDRSEGAGKNSFPGERVYHPPKPGEPAGPSAAPGPWPWDQEPPLPRSLPTNGETTPRQCPPKDTAPETFLFYSAGMRRSCGDVPEE